jgi:ferredoxin
MNSTDGRSDLIGATSVANGNTELFVSEKDADENQDAAEACPVNVIHIQKL